MLATVASRRCSGVIPGSGAPVGRGTDGPCLAPADGLRPGTVEPPPAATPAAEGASLPDPPLASFEALLLAPPELDVPGLDAFELGDVSEFEVLELDVSEDPPPHPANANAATASARAILALAVFVNFTRRR
jgi:hypothetical protein